MPEVSRFYGIVITFNYVDHLPPHFHARYGDDRATVSLDGDLLSGALSRRAFTLVREWAGIHRAELMNDWELARRAEPLLPIAPLD